MNQWPEVTQTRRKELYLGLVEVEQRKELPGGSPAAVFESGSDGGGGGVNCTP
jgi:hypothetical protein